MIRSAARRNRLHRSVVVVVLITFALTLAACAGLPRPERSASQLQTEKQAFRERQEEDYEAAVRKIVRRMEMIAAGETDDDTYDVLLLSGGGDWGIFGSAFMVGWLENGDPPLPEFDYVAGISTGSLIAAYTFSGEEARYRQMEQFYLATDEDFVTLGSMLGLARRLIGNSPALAKTGNVEAAIEAAVDEALVADILAGETENRLLGVGAVNLDLGLFNPFDVGAELRAADDPVARLQKILLASSAVPAAFPPVEIDGDLYADGGASVGIPIFQVRTLPDSFARYRRANGREPPPMRFWIVFNNKLGVIPAVTPLGWSDVLLRAYKIALQTTLVTPLYALNRTVQLSEATGKADIELRWAAIPEDYEEVAPDRAFVPEAMQSLRDLGRRMGGDPDTWRTDVPEF